MASSSPPPDHRERQRLIDENEQLRTSLESALEENTILTEERDRLRLRVHELSDELHATGASLSQQEQRVRLIEPAFARQGETEEELRVAFEELQVLTEELELANSGLQQTNQSLDARIDQRTAQLREINELLSSTEASLHAVANLVPELLWRTDGMGRADWFNQRWFSYTGSTASAPLGHGWLGAVHADDHAATVATWNLAVTDGRSFKHEFRIRNAAGDFRWFLVRAEPLHDDQGRITCWFAAGTDIHDQRISLEALQRSELRFRTLIEGIPQLVWRAVDIGCWTWSSPQWREYTGQDVPQALELGWLEALHVDDRAGALEAWQRAQSTGSLEIAGRILHAAEGRYRHFRTRALPVMSEDQHVLEWLGTCTDVDDLLQLQEEQGVLVAELQHRTRNLMSVVQAVTARTLKSAVSLASFEESITDRLSALARVQGLLSRRDAGARVSFDVLLREELSAHLDLSAADTRDKVVMEGPPGIQLRSATVQILALALHELATNAAKYGALSDRGGRLEVRWALDDADGQQPRLSVDWRESNVSDIARLHAPPPGGGYGRELIEKALPYQLGARTTYVLEPDGARCTIQVPILV